jgi:hypothetical protein
LAGLAFFLGGTLTSSSSPSAQATTTPSTHVSGLVLGTLNSCLHFNCFLR